MKKKKAQVALEFLMTYGWAILIVLVVLAALFSFGVFNPSTPNSCLIGAPFNCADIVVTVAAAGDSAVVSASGVQDGATVTFSGPSCTSSPATLNQANSFRTTVSLTCSGLTAGQRVAGSLTGTYVLQGSTLSHTITGTYSARVE